MVSIAVKLALVFGLISVLVSYKVKDLFRVPPLPEYEEQWWGQGEPRKVDQTVRPFVMNVSMKIIDDLINRLDRTIPLQKPLEGVKHHYGINTNFLENVIDFWKTHYNWVEREKYFNKLPQFLTNVQGLNIHFIHVKPVVKNNVKVLPLLLLHGWVGSIREFYELIPLLTTQQKDRDFVFEVVAASLPGFAYSDGASKPGLGSFHIAVLMKNLMLRLGFEKFYVHGTDWGASIVQHMSILFPDKVGAMHSNLCLIDTPLSIMKMFTYNLYPKLFVEEKEHKYLDIMFPLSKIYSFRLLETGYFHLQATKPDTVGVGLRESPAGLAAYLLEKFIVLTNPDYKNLDDGGLEKTYGLIPLIDNIMLYWVTNSITTSMRIYAEQWNKINRQKLSLERFPITVPSGCARFKYDIFFYPESVLKERYPNLIHLTYHEHGHFPAMEAPEVLAEDIFEFFDKVVKLKDENNKFI